MDLPPAPHAAGRLRGPAGIADLDLDGAGHPELRLDGYVGRKRVISRSFSSDPARDQFAFRSDDTALSSEEPDGTRLEFKVVDRFAANRAFATGTVTFALSGPGELVGINPFVLDPAGGAVAVRLRTMPGRISVLARHSQLGARTLHLEARPDVRIG